MYFSMLEPYASSIRHQASSSCGLADDFMAVQGRTAAPLMPLMLLCTAVFAYVRPAAAGLSVSAYTGRASQQQLWGNKVQLC
jgi:hypothetical protein